MILGVYNFNQLPTPARALICQCAPCVYGPYVHSLVWKQFGSLATCGGCKKLRIHNLWLCVQCDEYFVKDFSHPAWCPIGPKLCWYCTEESGYEPCSEWCVGKHPPTSDKKRPPLKPRIVKDPNFDPFSISFK
jgi:hypothetical protein